MELKRYSTTAYRIRARASSGECCQAVAEMGKSEDGDYILHADAVAALAEKDAEVERLKQEVPDCGNPAHAACKCHACTEKGRIPKCLVCPLERRIEQLTRALEEIWKYAAHGTATKQKDARGRIFGKIFDVARTALASPGTAEQGQE